MLPEISTEISDRNFGNNFKIQFFFSKNRQNWQFREDDSARKGVRLVKNFFLIEFGLICRKKFFTSPKLWGASPALYKSILTHQHQFWRKMMILTWWSLIFIQLWRAVSSRIIYKISPNRVLEYLGPSGSSSCCRNFLSKFLNEIPATLMKFRFSFSKNVEFFHFRRFEFWSIEVRMGRNFCLGASKSII